MDIEQMRRDAEAPVKADAASAESVARDLAAAFVDDPLFDWFSRTDARRDGARLDFFRFFMKALVLPSGETLRPASGGGAAIWMGSETQGSNTLGEELQALPVLLGLTGWRRFPRMVRLRGVMDKAHPMDRPHAYLWFLGVTPEAQGRGIGSRLLKAKLDQLDLSGTPAFLETATERNVALYRRHGFDVIAQYRPAPDAPPMWAMWREAAGGGG
jgi:ribosomal protein S18 acetylase RimI-like enzyme